MANASPGQGLPNLKWQAPASWAQAPDRPMRSVTFTMGADKKTECYVSVLGSASGGTAANVNRWRDQMGQPELAADAIAGLPRVTILGHESALAEIAGEFTGADGAKMTGWLLRGAVCETPDASIFVKMMGPESEVQSEKENFIAFCQSLSRGE